MKRCVTPRRIKEGDIEGTIKSGVRQWKGTEVLSCRFYVLSCRLGLLRCRATRSITCRRLDALNVKPRTYNV